MSTLKRKSKRKKNILEMIFIFIYSPLSFFLKLVKRKEKKVIEPNVTSTKNRSLKHCVFTSSRNNSGYYLSTLFLFAKKKCDQTKLFFCKE